jgi:hypothetical protein
MNDNHVWFKMERMATAWFDWHCQVGESFHLLQEEANNPATVCKCCLQQLFFHKSWIVEASSELARCTMEFFGHNGKQIPNASQCPMVVMASDGRAQAVA